jgi:hypothetical protein
MKRIIVLHCQAFSSTRGKVILSDSLHIERQIL